MKANVAKFDRILRAIVGIVLLGIAVIYNPIIGLIGSIIAGILGIVLLGVAITGFCPMYTLIGFQTLKENKKSSRKSAVKKKKK
ncbi:MAG: DUF2892 domain-containing protein [archaeon]|jgi:hypothetical protein